MWPPQPGCEECRGEGRCVLRPRARASLAGTLLIGGTGGPVGSGPRPDEQAAGVPGLGRVPRDAAAGVASPGSLPALACCGSNSRPWVRLPGPAADLPGEVSHTKQALSLGYAVVAINSLDRSDDPTEDTYRCFRQESCGERRWPARLGGRVSCALQCIA